MKKKMLAGLFSTFLLFQNSAFALSPDAVGSARSGEFTIGAGESNHFNIKFYADKTAFVDIQVINKEAKLTLSIFDSKGNLIAEDKEHERSWLGYKYNVNWTPKDSTVYKIKVSNDSSSKHYYYIEAN